ncbi:hypothetical protein PCC6912_56370 [Chlorogloeopsis fritschii PCC 6912]|uniref:Uncharacterized protein n=2 Tax=Chlorogloeopsis fritschii TaxID=1124 RepID=A0A3S0ZVU2_CHLFR|nr:hypothetical protein PCC6912_56370 [Chlorogloeopsis fritschii PCC 6912]
MQKKKARKTTRVGGFCLYSRDFQSPGLVCLKVLSLPICTPQYTIAYNEVKYTTNLYHSQFMKTISIQLPETVFSSLRKNPQEFVQEMRIAAAVKWYEIGNISQNKAAEIAGLTRVEFINALSRYRVDFMQYTTEELAEELANVD